MSEKFQIGWFNLKEDKVFRNQYSYAAWYEDVLVKAGKYPVFAREYSFNERLRKSTNEIKDHGSIWVSLDGVVVSDDFTSHVGGVPVGSNVDKNVGGESSHVIAPYAHTVARAILEGSETWELIEPFKAKWVHFEYNGEQKTTTKLINTEMEGRDE